MLERIKRKIRLGTICESSHCITAVLYPAYPYRVITTNASPPLRLAVVRHTTQYTYRAYPVHNFIFCCNPVPFILPSAGKSQVASAHSIASHKSCTLYVPEKLDTRQVR